MQAVCTNANCCVCIIIINAASSTAMVAAVSEIILSPIQILFMMRGLVDHVIVPGVIENAHLPPLRVNSYHHNFEHHQKRILERIR